MVASAINDDFDSVFGPLVGCEKRQSEEQCAGVSKKLKGDAEKEREFLRVYETMPAQMLNAYGMAAFATMTHEKVLGGSQQAVEDWGEVYDRALQ